MIIDFYKGNGGGGSGSGSTGPQGYQGPQGPQGLDGIGTQGPQGNDGVDGKEGPQGVEGSQGPQGENGINQDPTKLKAVSSLPESADTGDVVSVVESTNVSFGEWRDNDTYAAYAYDFIFDPREYSTAMQGMECTVLQFTGFDEDAGENTNNTLTIYYDESNGWSVRYEDGIEKNDDSFALLPMSEPQASETTHTVYVNVADSEISGIQIDIIYTDYEDRYKITVFADAEEGSDPLPYDYTFNDSAHSSSVSVKQYDGSDWVEVGSGSGSGATGPQGPQGADGADGAPGPQGAAGSNGADGAQGPQGNDGIDGKEGPQGADGAQGPQGAEGAQGPAGGGGAGGDSNVLRSVSGTPSGLSAGDVWAYSIPASEAVYNDDFVDTGYFEIEYDRYGDGNPQAIRLDAAALDGNSIGFRYACYGWDDGITVGFNSGEMSIDKDSWTQIDGTHIKLTSSDWMEQTGGKTVYIELVQDSVQSSDFYVYFYTDGPDKIWIYGISDNSYAYIYTGTVTPAHPIIAEAYQYEQAPDTVIASGNTAPTTQYRLMDVNVFNWPSVRTEVGYVTSVANDTYYIYLNPNQTAELYDGNTFVASAAVSESISRLDSNNNIFAFSNTDVSTYYRVRVRYNKTANQFTSSLLPTVVETGVTNTKLAKVTELPTEAQLLPKFSKDANSDNILSINYWDHIGPVWQNRTDVVTDGLRWLDSYSNVQSGAVLTKLDDYNLVWKDTEEPIKIEALSTLPTQTKDGNVHAYANASGYGIVQAQSGFTTIGWAAGTSEMSGYTQFRVPYTATNAGITEFYFDNPGDEGHNLWWHYYEDKGYGAWDGDNVPFVGQDEYGEFSGTDPWGVSISSVKSGDYLVVTFGTGVTSANEVREDTEIYTNYIAHIYANVVMSDSIARIWKGSQSEYDNLSSYDNNTFYIII